MWRYVGSYGANCPRCGARAGSFTADPESSPLKKLFLIPAACLAAILAVAAAVWFAGHRQSAELLEAAPSVRPHSWHAASTDLPSANLMYLPKADSGFVGSWGGHLRVQAPPGEMREVTMAVVPDSYYFGERNGVVFIKTNVYGNPQWPVVKTGVKVLNSRSIEFRIDSICKSCAPPQRQQEVTRLTLINPQQLAARVYAYSYRSGDGHVELTYKGTLHLLTPNELAAIDREVERDGKFLTRINRKIPINN